jgi:hypothetical protein
VSCFINPVHEDQCVFVTYEGEMTPAEIMAARCETNTLLLVKRWKRIVVDATELRTIPPTLELIDLTSDLSSELPLSTRIALIIRFDQVNHGKLAERVARTESMILTYFFDVEEATTWVKGVKPPVRSYRQTINTYEKQT